METESPLRQLRSRQTPSKDGGSSVVKFYNTPVGKWERCTENNSPVAAARQTRNSTLQIAKNHSTIGDLDGSESLCSTNSNAENENTNTRATNESTPQKSTSRLSRKRSTRLQSCESFKYQPSTNDSSIKGVFSRVPPPGANYSTPTMRRSERKSAKIFSLPFESSDDDRDCDRKRRTNKSYFTEEDSEEYVPKGMKKVVHHTFSEEETQELDSFEDRGQNEESDEDSGQNEESDEDSGQNEESDEDESIHNKRLLVGKDKSLVKLALTPELLSKLEGRSVGRRTGFNSPVATGSQAMSPNPETYFLAENRIKYKKTTKNPEVIMNDAMKGKQRKRRKMIVKMGSELPDKIASDFSVTIEALKATVNPQDFVSGNMHEERADQLYRNVIENEFPHWLGLFRDGFNVMLYGYGSKLPIFKAFEEFVNNQYLAVTVNGLFPKLNPRKLLYGICEYVGPELQIPHGINLESVAREAVKGLKTLNQSDIFILVNNFDSMALRFPQMLSVLSWLAQVPYIHLLASCDTANAFLGVTQSQTLQLNFCWMHCPTYQSYREEFKWTPGIYGDETKVTTQKSSLKYVLQSLTGNARKAFALLAQMQLKQMKSRAVQKAKEPYAGVRFQGLAKECREKFIAHSDENLRTLLVEFFDHHLIRQTGKGKHLENTLLIELDLETLEEIISELA